MNYDKMIEESKIRLAEYQQLHDDMMKSLEPQIVRAGDLNKRLNEEFPVYKG